MTHPGNSPQMRPTVTTLAICALCSWLGCWPNVGAAQEVLFARAPHQPSKRILVPVGPKGRTEAIHQHVARARSLLEANQYTAAVRALNQLLSSTVLMAEPWTLRAYAHFQLGQYDAAIADYSRAIFMEQNAKWYYNRALAYKRKGDLWHALADLDQAIALDPEAVMALFERGNILAEMGQWQEALRYYQRVVERAPAYRAAWLNLGKAHMELNQPDRAIQSIDAALALEVDSRALLMRSRCLLWQNRLKEAWLDALEALYVAPESADVYYLIGRIEQQRGDHEAALHSFEVAAELSDKPRYLLAQAQALFELGDYYRVIQRCNEVLASKPTHLPAWQLRDLAYDQIERRHRPWGFAGK